MNKTISIGWLIIPVIVIIGLQLYLIFINNKDESVFMMRDSTIQQKIDSISLNINTRFDHLIWANDVQIHEKEKRITNNKKKFKSDEDKLLHTPVDSVFNWTKSKLRERAR